MFRILIIVVILSSSMNARSQPASFDSAMTKLFFGVNVYNASNSLIDRLEGIVDLKYKDTVVNQWSLSASIYNDKKEETWQSRHVFTFTKSPIEGYKILEGQITVELIETATTKKLRSLIWRIDFDGVNDGEMFFNKLKEIFLPLSTEQKTEHYNFSGGLDKYSIHSENDKGKGDASFYVGISPQTKKYQVMLFFLII